MDLEHSTQYFGHNVWDASKSNYYLLVLCLIEAKYSFDIRGRVCHVSQVGGPCLRCDVGVHVGHEVVGRHGGHGLQGANHAEIGDHGGERQEVGVLEFKVYTLTIFFSQGVLFIGFPYLLADARPIVEVDGCLSQGLVESGEGLVDVLDEGGRVGPVQHTEGVGSQSGVRSGAWK